MATAKFFKKHSPGSPVTLANGQGLSFKTVDQQYGYFSTDSEGLQRELVAHIEGGRFGLSEITWDEYNDSFLKKKISSPPLRRLWREEISNSARPSPTQDLFNAPEKRNAAAVNQDCQMTTMADLPPGERPKVVEATTVDDFKVNVGRRD